MNELEPLRGIPHELDAAAKEWEQTPRIWVPNEKDGYALATVLAESANSDFFDVQICETGEKQRVSREDANKVNPLRYYKCEDMATMSCLNEPAVLYNLKQRYYQDLIYTYSGLFCVVINPYKHVKIYSDTIADCYKGRKRNEVPPHIFAVADEAYRNMLQNKEDQSILCTGESGAGKTENTKKLIQYLSHVAGSRKTKIDLDTSSTSGRSFVGHLEEQLLYANPILEAFGNSKTVKNDNSSRFGKFVRIHFDTAGYISGANIEFYLLEKSRVLRQAVQERSFHIFYQLIRGASKTMREELLLEHSPAKYRFLTNGDLAIPGVSDAKELQNTMDAMSIMGFSEEEIKSVFRVLSALLLFGNLEFASEGSNSDQARITNDSVLQKIAKLLHVNFDDLQRAILKPRIKVNREHTHRSQNEEQARFAVDAIAKATYERVFRWLVKRLNRSLDRTRQNAATFIGILDIAGFEIFERNSFEQLCINYTNEKLQQLFNSTMFVREQQEYLTEGIEWTMIDFGLNLQPTIDLIDKHLGVLSTLDDICLFPCGDDKSFVSKLTVQHQNHPKFIVPDMRSKNDFAIVHYAGRVDYSASEWRVKNMDPLNENVVEVLQVSKDMLVAEIWKDTTDMWKMCATEKDNVFGQRLKKGLFHTVSQLYKEQLSSLMATLNNTNPHFVRCIIPNHEKKAGVINGPLVLEQLRCNGVLEGIRIFRQGFPNRIPFQEFRQRYGKLLVPNAIPHEFIDGREAAQRIAIALDIDVKLYRIGQSKIFFRSGVVAELEILRDQKLAEFVVLFQAAARGSLARMRFQRMREQTNALNIIQRNGRSWMRLRNWNWWKLYTKVLPIVTANMKNEKIEEMESELADTREKLRKAEAVCTEMTLRIGTIEEDRDSVQQLYDRACLESNDASDELRRLANRNKDLNTQIDELTNQLMSEEKHRQIAEVEHLKIFESLGKLEKRLAAEEDDKKKLIDEKKAVEETLKELEDSKLGADETSAKLVKEKQQLEVRFKEVSERLNDAVRKIEELQDMVEKLRKELNSTKRELQEASIRFTTELSDKIEELRKKYSRELQEANARAEHEAAARSKAEKAMTKARQECDDLSRELSEMTIQNKVYERKQHRFDQQFAEEKRATDVLQETVNSLEQQNRTLQSKLLSINNDIDSKNMAIESLEKEKRKLVAEIDSLASQDAGANNPVELQKTKRRLEDEVATLTAEVEDLQDALGICETEKQRIEVKYQAARTGWDHQQRMRESEEDTGSRQLQQKLRATEEQLEDERRRRTSALSNKTKIEQECKSLQDEIDAINTENSKLKNKLSRLEDKYRLTVSEAENYKVLHSNELASVERMNKLYQKTRTDLRAAEDDLVSEVQKCREARHQILDLEEKVDTLSREVQQLQTRLKTEKRLSLITYGGVGRSRYGSSTSLNRVDETLNSEDSPRAPSRVFADDDGESVLSYHG